jgi:hypothetical protein
MNEAISTPAARELRLRREVGRFRERSQALSTILQDLQGSRAPQAILRSLRSTISSALGAEALWLIDGTAPSVRLLMRGAEPLPAAVSAEVPHCLREGRIISIGSEENGIVHLAPLSSGPVRWGVLAIRLPVGETLDAEALRFLSLSGSLIGGATTLWEQRLRKENEQGDAPAAWLTLSALPARVMLLCGETGTGKRTLAERMHDRYGGGVFAAVALTGGDDDQEVLTQALQRPHLRSLYICDALRLSAPARDTLRQALQRRAELVLFLGTLERNWSFFQDELFSSAAAFTIRLPALRERGAEIARLVQNGLRDRGVEVKLTGQARELLSRYFWPENYDELERFILHVEQALRLEGAGRLSGNLTRRLLGEPAWLDLPGMLDRQEAHILAEALRRLDGNRAAVARALCMTPRQTGYKCRKYGLE